MPSDVRSPAIVDVNAALAEQASVIDEHFFEAARIRLRPILMTSIAFLLGVLPLALASGASSVARNTIGWTVLGGMFAATSLAIFVVPVLFVVITRLTYGKQKLEDLRTQEYKLAE